MSTFRYLSTDLLTGRMLCDDIPLNVQSFSMQLNGSGSLTGNLALNLDYRANAPYLAALEPRRAVLWAMEDNYPVWAGVVWDWPHMSLADGTLPIQAQTLDSVFNHRIITETLEYPEVDIFQVFIDLVQYGMNKTSPYVAAVSPVKGSPSALVSQAGRVANLVLPSGPDAYAGVPWTASYMYSDLTQIGSAWSDMVSAGELEYAFVPGFDSSGNLAVFLRLGYVQLGRSADQSGYRLVYPGNCTDYGYQVTGSQSSNAIWATAPPNGSELQWESAYPHGFDLADLGRGYPLMEETVAWEGSMVTAQSQVDAFADGEVSLKTQGMTVPVINVAPGYPRVRDMALGDATWFTATSALHPPKPDGSPGLQIQVRVSGWTCYPPGPQQAQYTQLATNGVILGQ